MEIMQPMNTAETLQADVVRIDAVRVDKVLLGKMLDLMDKSRSEVGSELRRGYRLRYRVRNAVVYPCSSDKTVAFIVPTRNLSADGMAFLHSHMMHIGRPCIVQLPSRTRQWVVINATVVRCRHVRAMLHEVAVKFDKPIDLPSVYRMSGD